MFVVFLHSTEGYKNLSEDIRRFSMYPFIKSSSWKLRKLILNYRQEFLANVKYPYVKRFETPTIPEIPTTYFAVSINTANEKREYDPRTHMFETNHIRGLPLLYVDNPFWPHG